MRVLRRVAVDAVVVMAVGCGWHQLAASAGQGSVCTKLQGSLCGMKCGHRHMLPWQQHQRITAACQWLSGLVLPPLGRLAGAALGPLAAQIPYHSQGMKGICTHDCCTDSLVAPGEWQAHVRPVGVVRLGVDAAVLHDVLVRVIHQAAAATCASSALDQTMDHTLSL